MVSLAASCGASSRSAKTISLKLSRHLADILAELLKGWQAGDIDAPHISSITCRRSVPNIMRSTRQPFSLLERVAQATDLNCYTFLSEAAFTITSRIYSCHPPSNCWGRKGHLSTSSQLGRSEPHWDSQDSNRCQVRKRDDSHYRTIPTNHGISIGAA